MIGMNRKNPEARAFLLSGRSRGHSEEICWVTLFGKQANYCWCVLSSSMFLNMRFSDLTHGDTQNPTLPVTLLHSRKPFHPHASQPQDSHQQAAGCIPERCPMKPWQILGHLRRVIADATSWILISTKYKPLLFPGSSRQQSDVRECKSWHL